MNFNTTGKFAPVEEELFVKAECAVEEDEAERLMASGGWFDSPTKAKEYRAKVEDEIKQESKAAKPRAKQKGKDDERQ